jgi:hypothetical protein
MTVLPISQDDAIARTRGRPAESIRVDDVALDNVGIRVALGVLPDVGPLDVRDADVVPLNESDADVGPLDLRDADVVPLDLRDADVVPLDLRDADVVPLNESDGRKECTAFKGLDQGTTVGQRAAGRAGILANEESREPHCRGLRTWRTMSGRPGRPPPRLFAQSGVVLLLLF